MDHYTNLYEGTWRLLQGQLRLMSCDTGFYAHTFFKLGKRLTIDKKRMRQYEID